MAESSSKGATSFEEGHTLGLALFEGGGPLRKAQATGGGFDFGCPTPRAGSKWGDREPMNARRRRGWQTIMAQ